MDLPNSDWKRGRSPSLIFSPFYPRTSTAEAEPRGQALIREFVSKHLITGDGGIEIIEGRNGKRVALLRFRPEAFAQDGESQVADGEGERR